MPRKAPVTSRPTATSSRANAILPEASPIRLTATVRYCWKPCSTPRRTETIIQIIAVTGIAAAAHSWSTLISAAISERSGIAITAAASVPRASLPSHLYTPAPGFGLPSASSWLISLAAATWSAEPGTIMMMNEETSTARSP